MDKKLMAMGTSMLILKLLEEQITYKPIREEAYYSIREEEYEVIEDVLPQHYLNNYRIAYVILKYGWIIGSVFLVGQKKLKSA